MARSYHTKPPYSDYDSEREQRLLGLRDREDSSIEQQHGELDKHDWDRIEDLKRV